MRKGVFIENCLLRCNGGELTPDSAVQRVDIEAYLPAAVNYVVTAGRNTNIKIEGDRDYPSAFFGVFNDLTIIRTSTIPTFTFPKGYIPLASNEGIRSISDNCGNYYNPLTESDRRTIKYYGKLMTGQCFFFPLGANIELYGVPPLAEKINGVLLVDSEELADTDHLPIQAGFEEVALKLIYEWISGERESPADVKNTGRDINIA